MEIPSLVLISKQDALTRALDVAANNIANASTTGFKQDRIVFDEYLAAIDGGRPVDYVVDKGTYRDASQGPILRTGNPLDVALMGDGYLPVQTKQGTLYTRAGSMTTNQEGELITPAGNQVLSADGQPIVIPPEAESIEITKDGSVRTEDGEVGRIQAFVFKDEQSLVGVGDGLYRATRGAGEPTEATQIIQGAIEQSNVQPVIEMTRVIEISRAYQATARLLDQEQERMRTALRTLGRLAG